MTPTYAAILLLLRCMAGEQAVCAEAIQAAERVPELTLMVELGREELARR
jgi:hypothetical protein